MHIKKWPRGRHQFDPPRGAATTPELEMRGFGSAVVECRQTDLNAVDLGQLGLQPLRAHATSLSADSHTLLRTMPGGVVLDNTGRPRR